MATNTSPQGDFIWDPTPHSQQPPDNVQSGDIVLADKINEVKDKADFLDDNIESCFNEKLTYCSDRETSKFIENHGTNYTDDKSELFSAQQSTNFNTNYDTVNLTDRSSRDITYYGSYYDDRYTDWRYTVNFVDGCCVYCGARTGVAPQTGTSEEQGSSCSSYTASGYKTNKSTNETDYRSVVEGTKYDSYNETERISVKSTVRDSENTNNNTTVCTILS